MRTAVIIFRGLILMVAGANLGYMVARQAEAERWQAVLRARKMVEEADTKLGQATGLMVKMRERYQECITENAGLQKEVWQYRNGVKVRGKKSGH